MAKGIAHGRTITAANRDQENGRLSMKGYFAVFNREVSLTEARVQFPEFMVGELVTRRHDRAPRILSVVEVIDGGLRSDVELLLSDGSTIAHYLVDHVDEVRGSLDQDGLDRLNLLVSGEEFEVGRVAVAVESGVGIDQFGAVISGVEAGGVRQDVVGLSETPGLTRVFAATVDLVDHITGFEGPVPATVVAPAPPIVIEFVSGPTPAEIAESIRESRENAEIATEIANDPQGPAHLGEAVHVAIFGTDEEASRIDSGDRFMIDPEAERMDEDDAHLLASDEEMNDPTLLEMGESWESYVSRMTAQGMTANLALVHFNAQRRPQNREEDEDPDRPSSPPMSEEEAEALVRELEEEERIATAYAERMGALVEAKKARLRGETVENFDQIRREADQAGRAVLRQNVERRSS